MIELLSKFKQLSLSNKLLYGSIGTVAGTYTTGSIIENRFQNFDTNVEKPIDTISIILPTYNEEQFITRNLFSLINQSIINQYPQYFEFILIDSNSSDKSIELAIPFINYLNYHKHIQTKLIETEKRGKLTARNIATDLSTGNIIVSIDADTIYPPYYLNTILKPFHNPEVIGVDGSELDYSIPNIPGKLMSISFLFQKLFKHPNRLYGRHSAYMKHSFYEIGKFNESIDQMNIKTIMKEEEIDFGNKLSKLGKIVFKMNACCYHLGGERVACRSISKGSTECNKYGIGIERFGPINTI